MKETSTDYYTEPRRETNIQLIETLAQTTVRAAMKTFGEILVTSQVTGFRKSGGSRKNKLDWRSISPASELITKGYG